MKRKRETLELTWQGFIWLLLMRICSLSLFFFCHEYQTRDNFTRWKLYL